MLRNATKRIESVRFHPREAKDEEEARFQAAGRGRATEKDAGSKKGTLRNESLATANENISSAGKWVGGGTEG